MRFRASPGIELLLRQHHASLRIGSPPKLPHGGDDVEESGGVDGKRHLHDGSL